MKAVTKHFKQYNPNPANKKTSDCVIRALCKATNKEWDSIYVSLMLIGFELKTIPNDGETWKKYLMERGFVYNSIAVTKGSKRPTVYGFAKEHPEGTYVLKVAKHIVTVVDGYYYDIYDCGVCSVYSYWEKR